MNPTDHARKVRSLLRRDGDLCHFCRDALNSENISLDHVIPRARGGSNELTNLVLACKDCNNARGCMGYDKFVRLMGKATKRPGILNRPRGDRATRVRKRLQDQDHSC